MFFDGFKAIEAIGEVDPNGIVMDKDERLACSRWKYLCYYLKPKEFVIITCTILRDWSGVLESVKYEALLSAISEFRKSQMSANSYSQPTVRILTKKPWTVTFNSSSNCLQYSLDLEKDIVSVKTGNKISFCLAGNNGKQFVCLE